MTPIISDPSDTLGARRQADQALAVPVEPVSRLDPSGFDPSRGASLAELLDHDPALLAAAYAPVNMMIDHLWAGLGKTPAVEWLERAGPIAAKLNEDAKHD